MSHEHRALGFRPPPGSLAAEAQAAIAKQSETADDGGAKRDRRNSTEVLGNANRTAGQKARRVSFGANLNSADKPKRGPIDNSGNGGSVRQRRSSSSAHSNTSQNSLNGIRRTTSDNNEKSGVGGAKVNGKDSSQRRKSLNLSAMPEAAKEELLKEVAWRDAERIKCVPISRALMSIC